MNNNLLQKIYEYLAAEWDLFKYSDTLAWNHTLLEHVHIICEKAKITETEEKIVRNALIGKILGFDDMNAQQILQIYYIWATYKFENQAEEEFRAAILDTIKEEFAAFKRA